MVSQNVNDAKKECSYSPSCHMFYHEKGAGSTFAACKVTASISISTAGDILYTLRGNQTYSLNI